MGLGVMVATKFRTTKAFQETISNIKDQQTDLTNQVEKAVEQIVILPLLKRLGWNVESLSEVYPQASADDRDRVDFELKLEDRCRVIIEAKRWSEDLRNHESKLQEYCLKHKPPLAVLTNGRQWRMYRRPRRWAKSTKLENCLFLELSITEEDSSAVEANLRTFLAKDKVTGNSLAGTLENAQALLSERQNKAAINTAIKDALNTLSLEDWAALIAERVKASGYQVESHGVLDYLTSHGFSFDLAGEPKKAISFPKPYSFTFRTKDKEPLTETFKGTQGWNELLVRVCCLMHQLHQDTFQATTHRMPQWFAQSNDTFKDSNPIGDTGVYVKYGGKKDVQDRIPSILASFGHSPDSLTIKER